MSDTATESREVQRIRSGRDWSGYLTLENFDAVAGRLREMLEGKRYTWVSCNEGLRDFFPEVRPGMEMEKIVIHDRSDIGYGCTMAHLTVCDTYGVWGLDATVPDQKTAHERRQAAWERASDEARSAGRWQDRGMTHIHFDRTRYDQGQLKVEHHNGYGDRLYWVIAVEPEQEKP